MRTLAVWLDGAPGPVGALTSQPGGGFPVRFAYDTAYLRHPQAVPLSAALPLRPAAGGPAGLLLRVELETCALRFNLAHTADAQG